MIAVTSQGSYLICRLFAYVHITAPRRAGEERKKRNGYTRAPVTDPRFFIIGDGIRVFVQIRIQVGHSGQCRHFISAASGPSAVFLVSVYSTITNATNATRGNHKDATRWSRTNISPTNTSPFRTRRLQRRLTEPGGPGGQARSIGESTFGVPTFALAGR
jgi:hypothetical protein